jgi:hypothetical protein
MGKRTKGFMLFVVIASLYLMLPSGAPAADRWAKIISGPDGNQATGMTKTADGGFILSGYSRSAQTGAAEAWLARFDGSGAMEWHKAFPGVGSAETGRVRQTQDGGYIFATTYETADPNDPNGRIPYIGFMKVSASGDPVMQKMYSSPGIDGSGLAFDIMEDMNGGYTLLAWTTAFTSYYGNGWILRLDPDGTILWQNLYRMSYATILNAFRQTPDGGYIAAGTYSMASPWVLKLDSSGAIQWQKAYSGPHSLRESGQDVKLTPDGGYIVVGKARSSGTDFDALAFKLDSGGELEWQRTYGGIQEEEALTVVPTEDHGYLIAGTTRSFGFGKMDVFALKTDAGGGLEWQKCFGGPGEEIPAGLEITQDSGFLMAYASTSLSGNQDVRLLKTDAQGGLPLSCDQTAETDFTILDPGRSLADTGAVIVPTPGLFEDISAQAVPGPAHVETQCISTTAFHYLAAAANGSGAGGTQWKTDAGIFNPNTTDVTVTYSYTPQGQDGTLGAVSVQETLPAGRMQSHADIVGEMFHKPGSAGTVRIASDLSVQLSSRTYNDQGAAGTYGQYIPGTREDDAVGRGARGYLIGLQNNAAFRTNLGFAETRGMETTATLRIFDSMHQLLCSSEITVPPFSWLQKSVAGFGAPEGADFTADVEWTSGGALQAYASVVDNSTGDSIFVPAQKESLLQGHTHYLIPVIAKALGANGTDWRSDVWIYNPLEETQTLQLTFTDAQGSQTQTLEIPGLEDLIIGNIGDSLFHLDGDRSGGLQIQSQNGLVVTSRTYNDQGNAGTFGQTIPAKTEWEMLQAGDTGRMLQLAGTRTFRTNVGFTNFSGQDAQVEASLYGLTGALLGSKTYAVPAYLNVQINDIFADMGIAGDVPVARADVRILGGGPVYAYASVVDNSTGDAIFIPAAKP